MGKEKKHSRLLRWTVRFILTVLLLFTALILFIRSPWGQDVIVTRVVNYISGKTNTEVVIDRLYLDFAGDLVAEGVYLEDQNGDTLLYSGHLEASLDILPLLFNNQLNLESVYWDRLDARISRSSAVGKFNFEFLAEALTPPQSPARNAAAEPMEISLGSLELSDFRILYADEITGVEARVKLGELYAEVRETDPESMVFDFESLELSKTNIAFTQNTPGREQDSATAPLPTIRVGDLKMDGVVVNYESVPDSLTTDFKIGKLNLGLPGANLADNAIDIDHLYLANSELLLHARGTDTAVAETGGTPGRDSGFQWPEFQLNARDITFENDSFRYKAGNIVQEKRGFDPQNIRVSGLDLDASTIVYRPESLTIDLDALSFAEKGGFTLDQLAFESQIDNDNASLTKITINSGGSFLEGKVNLEYADPAALINSPAETRARIEFSGIRLEFRDVFQLYPELEQNAYLREMARKPLTGKIIADGSMADLRLKEANFAWGDSTSLAMQGHIRDITRKDSAGFRLDAFHFTTSRQDVMVFVPGENIAVSLPRDIEAKGSLSAGSSLVEADIDLATSYGNMQINGRYQMGETTLFKGNARVEEFRLDSLLNNDQLGKVGLNLEFSGSGGDLATMDAVFETRFSQLQWREYDFSSLALNGKVQNGKGNIRLSYQDGNLNFSGVSRLDFKSQTSEIRLELDVVGADLKGLGLTRNDIRTAFDIRADYRGTASDFTVDAQILNGVAVYENRQYHLGDFQLSTDIDSVKTNIEIQGEIINGSLKSNTSVKGMELALRRQFRGYFEQIPDTGNKGLDSVEVAMRLKITPNPILDEVFFNDIEKLDSIVFRADYRSASNDLNAVLHVPTATYRGSTIDSLHVLVEGSAEDLVFSAALGSLNAGPIHMRQTTFSGNLINRKLLMDFNSRSGERQIMHIAYELDISRDTLNLHINPAGLVLNTREWNIPENNRITIAENMLKFENVELSRNSQNLTLSNSFPGTEKEHIGIGFENFRLQTFLSLLNPEEQLVSGSVSGELVIENPFGATGMVSDFRIAEFQVLENRLGSLTFNGTSRSRTDYGFNMGLKGDNVNLELKGSYMADATGAALDLNLELHRIDLKLIESFSEGALKETGGTISGSIDVAGTTTSPEYDGSLQFNEAEFTIASLNSPLHISDELLRLDEEGIYLNDFSITDANGSGFLVDGSILTEDLLNPGFDLKLDTENFRLLDSTEEDNELFYGTASVDADLTLQGNLDLPRISGRLRVRKVTDVTYVVPEARLDVQERDGVVIFVNRENPDAILTRNEQVEEGPANFKGMDLEAVVEIDEDAEFSIIIDERTGDNLKVSGEGALSLSIEPNGRTNLSGRYELQSGHYETNLYNLVNRRFEINPGSSISWQGDPMDAKLDVTAVYTVETSAAPLMATVTSAQSSYATGQYRQVLPFLVYLNVDGELMEPELSFDLDMPEDEQGIFGGAVYSRVQQLNQQEAELNKQVFSLLALNRFYPTSGSDGSAGGTAAIARDNVNKVLSGELNAFSDQIFGDSGLELDFDLESFTDYQGETPQDRTQLNINASKKLFDDRFIVTAGSAVDVEGSAQPGQEETPIIGNLSLEYLLTENGRFRLRGYRKSEYENIIDGQLIITGLALIFNREFNKFSDLFSPLDESGDTKEAKE